MTEIKDINKDFKPLDEKFKNTSKETIQRKISNLPKNNIHKILNNYHGYLLSTNIFTIECMDIDFDFISVRDLEWLFKYYGGIKEYDKLQDIEFNDEIAKKEIVIKDKEIQTIKGNKNFK